MVRNWHAQWSKRLLRHVEVRSSNPDLGILSPFATARVVSRAKGPQGMVQGAATYGLFSLVFAFPAREDELDVVDVPVDAPIKR